MKKLAFVAVALVAFAGPAHATSSATCRSTADPQLQLDLVIGHLAGPVIAQARLHDGDAIIQTGVGDRDAPMIAQSWLEDRALHLDIVAADGSNYVARLRTWRRSGRGEFAGSLHYGGRQHQVRCRIEDEG